MNVLTTTNLSKKYGVMFALKDVNINIKKGDIYGLIGENGSGKTTLIRTVTKLILPTEGSFELFENEKRPIGAIVEAPALYLNATAIDNLKIQATIIGINDKERLIELLNLVGLEEVIHSKKKVKNFSLGMKQRLNIAMTLLNEPEFVLLDEPMNGLDPEGIISFRNLILKLNKEKGITFLISSHFLDELSKVATKYGFLYKGRLIEEITKKDILDSLHKETSLYLEDPNKAVDTLKVLGIRKYEIRADHITIYNDIDVSKIILELSKENITITNVETLSSSIENYYIKLMEASREKTY